MRFLFISALVLGVTVSAFAQSAVLDSYVGVAQALAADDLSAAKKAATGLEKVAKADKQAGLAEAAAGIASSDSLDAAREHFQTASGEAEKLAAGKKGYYVFTCPMVKADWVQKTTKVQNPYMGQAMSGCGSLKNEKSGSMPQTMSMGGCCG